MGMGTMSLLESLPPELLYTIKEEIPLTDLRTHVCLYKSSPILAALYGDDIAQEKYWERACMSVGLGVPDAPAYAANWKEIAFTCIEEDGWCSHPQCGVARLEWNATEIEAMGLSDFTITGLQKFMKDVHGQDEPEDGLYISPLFEHMAFHASMKETMEEDVLLDYRNGLVNEEEPANLLHRHPIAARSFAVFPVLNLLSIAHPVFILPAGISNPMGVTVFDVMEGIFQTNLEQVLTIPQLRDSAYYDAWETALGQVYAVNFPEALTRVESLRQFFYYFRLNGFEVQEWVVGDSVGYPMLSLESRVARITRPEGGSRWDFETIAAEDG
ncbi:hypothetical protein K474DRAFT_1709091 [Panus rudis PR-1116 ss-1]|nr:hypothetical protein K474DRAFT_1709091 [Panus rudis PR-1116 ss-1]